MPLLVWVEGVSPALFDGAIGVWSPTSNELLLTECRGYTMSRVNADALTETDITPPGFVCFHPASDEPAWTPDGQSIVFGGPPPDTEGLFYGTQGIWVMKRDGAEPHPINPDETMIRSLEFRGWMDDHTLAYRGASGTFQLAGIIDITTGNHLGPYLIPGGIIHSPNANYLPATSLPFYRLGVITKTRPSEKQIEIPPRFMPAVPCGTEAVCSSRFEDWQPGTNKALVLTFYWEHGNPAPPFSQLVSWDLDTDVVVPIVPDGTRGKFAPDGLTLAYLTFGPAQLDGEDKPVHRDSDSETDLTPYLQLLSIETGRVTLSMPVVVDPPSIYPHGKLYEPKAALEVLGRDKFYNKYYFFCSPITAFSSDGKLLALLTPGEILLDQDGRPIGVENGSIPYLHLLNVRTGQILYSAPSSPMMPIWSPNSQKLIYRDEQGDLSILSVSDSHSVPLTRGGGQRASSPQWSHDGTYLSVSFRENEKDAPKMAIIEAP